MNAETGKCVAREQLTTELGHLRSNWLWLMLFGVLLAVCGATAIVYPVLTTVVGVKILGMLLTIAGIATIVMSFWAGKWSGLLVQLLIGILYLIVGFMITEKPLQSAVTLTAFVAAFFIVAGGFRILAAMLIRFPHWGWALLNGVVTFVLGVIIYHHFPACSLWVLGLLIGLEMLFNGWTWIMLSMAVHSLPEEAA